MPPSDRLRKPAGPNTYFDPSHELLAAKLLPGEYYATKDDMVLVTVLGSCVAACIRDPQNGIGGMNHFMLPEAGHTVDVAASRSARYGLYAMEVLINDIVKLGGDRNRLEAKVFGGGNVMKSFSQSHIGARNASFVLDYVRAEGIELKASDLLDIYPRKVYFFPRSGRVRVKRLRELHNDTIFVRERQYREDLVTDPVEGAVELFQ